MRSLRRRGSRLRQRKERIAVPTQVRYHLPKEMRSVFETFVSSVQMALAAGAAVELDFRQTTSLYPCGLLLLMGLVDEWTDAYPNRLTARYPEGDIVEQMLQQVGVLQKLGLEPRKSISHSDVLRWHYFTGRDVDGKAIEPFMDEVRPLVSEEAQAGLYDCIAEAMTNVHHHAYDAAQDGRWWMFGTISDKRLFVAMHDRGETIPGTLLAKPQFRDYLTGRTLGLRDADGQLISLAVGGRTSTRLSYRGKGLPEMAEFTNSTPQSDLAIYSRRGFYRLSNQGHAYQTHGNLPWQVPGTLLLWTINLSAGVSNE